jgi:hypothetical protein
MEAIFQCNEFGNTQNEINFTKERRRQWKKEKERKEKEEWCYEYEEDEDVCCRLEE